MQQEIDRTVRRQPPPVVKRGSLGTGMLSEYSTLSTGGSWAAVPSGSAQIVYSPTTTGATYTTASSVLKP